MSAARASRVELRSSSTAATVRPRETMRAERRRRQRHFRLRRRDLVLDTAMALGLTVVLISVTAGLGVLALLELPVSGVLVGSLIVERVWRLRQVRGSTRRPHRIAR